MKKQRRIAKEIKKARTMGKWECSVCVCVSPLAKLSSFFLIGRISAVHRISCSVPQRPKAVQLLQS